MKNKLRHVHIGKVEWSFAVSDGEVRIYKPGTKQIVARVNSSALSEMGVSPRLVKNYIINNIIFTDSGIIAPADRAAKLLSLMSKEDALQVCKDASYNEDTEAGKQYWALVCEEIETNK